MPFTRNVISTLTPVVASVGILFGAAAPVLAQSQECRLEVAVSEDAIGGELHYETDSYLTQAVLFSFHRYDDGATLTAVSTTTCEDDSRGRCIGIEIEGLLPGDERSFWQTELVREGDQLTVTTRGFADLEMTQPYEDGVYVDVYTVKECVG